MCINTIGLHCMLLFYCLVLIWLKLHWLTWFWVHYQIVFIIDQPSLSYMSVSFCNKRCIAKLIFWVMSHRIYLESSSCWVIPLLSPILIILIMSRWNHAAIKLMVISNSPWLIISICLSINNIRFEHKPLTQRVIR